MANNYNITWANFGLYPNKVFLSDPEIWIKEWGTLDATLKNIGYVNYQKSFKQKIDNAIMEVGIPKSEIRRDMVKQTLTFEASTYQLQPEILAILLQRRFSADDFEYPASSGTMYKRLMFGSNLPAVTYFSMIMKGTTMESKGLYLLLRKVRFIADDFSLVIGGDKHSEQKFTVTCLPDATPYANNSEWPLISKYTKASCGTTDASAVITQGTTSGIEVGDYVYGTGIPAGATVLSIVTNTSFTISAAATATASVTCTFDDISHASRPLDTIGRFLFQQ